MVIAAWAFNAYTQRGPRLTATNSAIRNTMTAMGVWCCLPVDLYHCSDTARAPWLFTLVTLLCRALSSTCDIERANLEGRFSASLYSGELCFAPTMLQTTLLQEPVIKRQMTSSRRVDTLSGSDTQVRKKPRTRSEWLEYENAACVTHDGQGNDEQPQSPETVTEHGESCDSRPDNNLCDSVPTPNKPYCTQACLLGLKRGLDLDEKCPNVHLHRSLEGGAQHQVDALQFTRLMEEQLSKSPARKCTSLAPNQLEGRTGVLFKLELEPYGYTLVAKGSKPGHAGGLVNETEIYGKLEKLQGTLVPVNLGVIHISKTKETELNVRNEFVIRRMLLMSWGGPTLQLMGRPVDGVHLSNEADRSEREIEAEGVIHDTHRSANRLWNQESGRVMIIDFDHSYLSYKPAAKQDTPGGYGEISGRVYH